VLLGIGATLGLAAIALATGALDASWAPAIALVALAVLAIGVVLRTRRQAVALDDRSAAAAGWREFRRELARARRHDRPVTIARLSVGDSSVAPGRLSSGPQRSLRRADMAWVEDGELFLLLPDAGRGAAERAIGRVAADLGLDRSVIRLAVFPEDGLTSGALLTFLAGDPATTPRVLANASQPDDLIAERAGQR
jgi:hypothetical protein